MMTLAPQLARLRQTRRRQLTAERLLPAVLIFGLLLIPATCANAAGPHSLFLDPMPADAHAAHGEAARAPMTQAELEMHVLLGHFSANGAPVTNDFPSNIDIPDEDACNGSVRLKDLPSTMAMAAAMSPMLLSDELVLALPSAGEPENEVPELPVLISQSPESPPPRS